MEELILDFEYTPTNPAPMTKEYKSRRTSYQYPGLGIRNRQIIKF